MHPHKCIHRYNTHTSPHTEMSASLSLKWSDELIQASAIIQACCTAPNSLNTHSPGNATTVFYKHKGGPGTFPNPDTFVS